MLVAGPVLALPLLLLLLPLSTDTDPAAVRERRLREEEARDAVGRVVGEAEIPRDPASPPHRRSPPEGDGADGRDDDAPVVRRVVHGRAVSEGKYPVADVQFLDMRSNSTGTWEVYILPGPTDSIVSGMDGTFSLPWVREDDPPAFLVMADHVVLEGVSGGTVVGDDSLGKVIRVDGPEGTPLELRFRDKENSLLVRPVDAETGRAVPPVEDGFSVMARWQAEEPGASAFDLLHWKATGGGWLRLSGLPVRDEDAQASRDTLLEVVADGYAIASIKLPPRRGRVEVPLHRPREVVRGRVILPTGWEECWGSLLPADGAAAMRMRPFDVRGLPETGGPFTLLDVPEGVWRLEVQAEEGDTVFIASREFRMVAGGVDLGEVRLERSGELVIELRDRTGKPIPEEQVFATPFVGPEEEAAAESEEPGRRLLHARIEYQGRSASTDAEGRAVLRGFPPGADLRVGVSGGRGNSVRVGFPEAPGGTVVVPLTHKRRIVECRLRLVLKDAPGVRWGPILEGNATLAAPKDGILTGSFLSGNLSIRIFAAADGSRSFRAYNASIEIPEQDGLFEADLEVQ